VDGGEDLWADFAVSLCFDHLYENWKKHYILWVFSTPIHYILWYINLARNTYSLFDKWLVLWFNIVKPRAKRPRLTS